MLEGGELGWGVGLFLGAPFSVYNTVSVLWVSLCTCLCSISWLFLKIRVHISHLLLQYEYVTLSSIIPLYCPCTDTRWDIWKVQREETECCQCTTWGCWRCLPHSELRDTSVCRVHNDLRIVTIEMPQYYVIIPTIARDTTDNRPKAYTQYTTVRSLN